MNKISIFLVLLSLTMITSCGNDVDLLTDSGSIPIVFGLYNRSETEQLVSISKTFRFPEDGGALVSAKSPDSIYFSTEELSVRAENEANGLFETLERVDLAAEGIVREDGVFPTEPNIYYRYNTEDLSLNIGDTLNLILERNGEFLGSTFAVTMPELVERRSREFPDTYAFTSDNELTFSWQRLGTPEQQDLIQTLEIGFNIAITERSSSGDKNRVLYWPTARNLAGSSNAFQVDISGFFDFLSGALVRDEGICRKVRYVQLVITGGDQNFTDFRELVVANQGITSTQELPPFSNIEGGVGLFGGITQLKQDTTATLTPDSFDELFMGDTTGDLGFDCF